MKREEFWKGEKWLIPYDNSQIINLSEDNFFEGTCSFYHPTDHFLVFCVDENFGDRCECSIRMSLISDSDKLLGLVITFEKKFKYFIDHYSILSIAIKPSIDDTKNINQFDFSPYVRMVFRDIALQYYVTYPTEETHKNLKFSFTKIISSLAEVPSPRYLYYEIEPDRASPEELDDLHLLLKENYDKWLTFIQSLSKIEINPILEEKELEDTIELQFQQICEKRKIYKPSTGFIRKAKEKMKDLNKKIETEEEEFLSEIFPEETKRINESKQLVSQLEDLNNQGLKLFEAELLLLMVEHFQ